MNPQLNSGLLVLRCKGITYLFLVVFSSMSMNLWAQNDTGAIRVSPEVFITKDHNLTIEQVLEQRGTLSFQPISALGRSNPNEIYWIRADLTEYKEKLSNIPEWTISLGSFDHLQLFLETPEGLQTLEFGYLAPMAGQKRSLTDYMTYFKSEELIEGRYIYLRCRKLLATFSLSDRIMVLTPKPVMDARNDGIFLSFYKRSIPAFIFTGLVLIVLLFSISAYVVQKRKEYLYYSFYLFALLAYLTRRPLGIDDLVFAKAPMLDYIIHSELQVLINLCYTLFSRHFLNTEVYYPKLDWFIKRVVILLLAFIVIDIALILAGEFHIHLIMMDAQRYFMATFGILGSIYLLVKRKSPLVYFIVIGSFAYTLGALGTLFLLNLSYMLTGSAIEVFVFTLGLGYKSRNLITKHARIQQEVLQLEMKALRAQMKPHFIFNSLGSIQHLIRRDKKQDALHYLSQFSRLLRQILDSSNQGTVSLQEETELLRNYIELEALRFDGKFEYDMTVEESLDPYNLEIPILLIQPHVENAILHGLLPKKGDCRLTVNFTDRGEFIRCEIEDNGIGRARSAAMKSSRGVTHQSKGLSIVAGRVSNLHGKYEDLELIKIDDIFDEKGDPAGTRVTICIPKEE